MPSFNRHIKFIYNKCISAAADLEFYGRLQSGDAMKDDNHDTYRSIGGFGSQDEFSTESYNWGKPLPPSLANNLKEFGNFSSNFTTFSLNEKNNSGGMR